MDGEVGVATRGDLDCCLAGVAAEGDPSSLMEMREETSTMVTWVHWEKCLLRSSLRGLSVA